MRHDRRDHWSEWDRWRCQPAAQQWARSHDLSEGGDRAAREAGRHFNDPGRRRAELGRRFVVKPINIVKPLCALEHERVKEWHFCRHVMTSVSGFDKLCWQQMNLPGGSWAQWGRSRVGHLLPVFPFVREQWEMLIFSCAFQWRNSPWRKQHLKLQVLLGIEITVLVLISTETRSFQSNRLPIGLRHHILTDVESGLQPEPWGRLSPGWGGDLTFRQKKREKNMVVISNICVRQDMTVLTGSV